MLSGAARLDAPIAGGSINSHYPKPSQIVHIEGSCVQTLEETVVIPPRTLLVFSFADEFVRQDVTPRASLTLYRQALEPYIISFRRATHSEMIQFGPFSNNLILVAEQLTPLGEFDARLTVTWDNAAICPHMEVTFRLATITGNPADQSILGIAEVPTVGDSASSGRGSAAEGAARVGCALNPHTSSSTSSLVWSFLCVVLLGLSLVSIRVRSSPAGRLES
jgi:hypothetical protein